MSRRLAFCMAVVGCFVASATAHAGMRVVHGEGRAPLAGKNIGPARQAALANALHDAAGMLGTKLRGASTIDAGGALRESVSALVEGRFSGYKILNEGPEGGVYVVRIEAVGESSEDACGGKRVDLDMRAIRLRVAPGIAGQIQRSVADDLSRSIALLGEGSAFRVSDQRALPELTGGERTHASQYDYMAQLTNSTPIPAGYSLSGEIIVERARRDGYGLNVTDITVEAVLQLKDNYTGARIGTIRRSISVADRREIMGYGFSSGAQPRVDASSLFAEVRNDLESQLACQPLRAAVLKSGKGQVLLSVGIEHGVTRGDFFLVMLPNARNDWQIIQIEEATPLQSVARLMKPSPAIPADALATLMR